VQLSVVGDAGFVDGRQALEASFRRSIVVDGCNSFELCTPMTLQNTRLLFTGEPGFPVSVLEETSTEINGVGGRRALFTPV
jgi:hypothetical protein